MTLPHVASLVQAERLPAGSYTITPEMQQEMAAHTFGGDAFSAEVGGPAHPIFAHLATHCGKSWTFNDFLAHVGAVPEDGVVFGGGSFAFQGPLRLGTAYRIDAWVSAAVRKVGRRVGVFDAITMTHLATAPGDEDPTVRTTETYIVPRHGVDANAATGEVAGDAPPVSPSPADPDAEVVTETLGPVEVDSIKAIMALMDDTNPVHLDLDLALRTGYRGRVNQGPANLAYLLGAVARWRDGVQDLRGLSFRFQHTVTEGDVLDVVAPAAITTAPAATVGLDIHGVGTALVAQLDFAPRA